jgi:membrane protein implicated in regulation of membrane protease activity
MIGPPVPVPPEGEFWLFVISLVASVVVGFFLLGRALPMRADVVIFAAGTATLVFLGYRLYQSEVDACKDSIEVANGGDKFSCLEPGNLFADALAAAFLLLIELGLASLVVGGFVRWQEQRRLRSGQSQVVY